MSANDVLIVGEISVGETAAVSRRLMIANDEYTFRSARSLSDDHRQSVMLWW